MSEYTTRSIYFTLRARAATIAQDLLLAECGSLSSVKLSAITNKVLSGEPMVMMDQRWQQVEALDGATHALSRADQNTYKEACRQREAAIAARGAGRIVEANRHAMVANNALKMTIDSTVGTLRSNERQLATLLTQRALTDLGYSVNRAEGQRSAGLWAQRGHHVIAVLVQDGGAMEIDNAGVSGGGCTAPMQELQRALTRLGAEADVVRRIDHGDDRGGHLIHRACRVNADPPEQGLVTQFEEGVDQATQRESASAPLRRTSIVGES